MTHNKIVGAAKHEFHFGLRYHYDQNAKDRTAYIERDESNDKRAFALAERSNEVMNKLSTAVDLNTKAVAEMVNLLGTNVQT